MTSQFAEMTSLLNFYFCSEDFITIFYSQVEDFLNEFILAFLHIKVTCFRKELIIRKNM